ncbi:MAG: LolA family protein [Planctomycetota bacterium]|jgi:outer membrane lipoprotein-sorting protein
MKRQDYLDHNLNELFKYTELKLHMPADRKADALNRLLQQAETPTEYERASVSWIKWAAAAMVMLAVILGSISLMDKSGVAFADILDNLQLRGYTFTYWSKHGEGELKKIGRGMVLQPGLIRWDMPEDQVRGLAIVVDAINHKMRWVTTSGKDLGETETSKEVQDPNLYQSPQNFLLNPVETLWGLVDGTEQSLGEATKDGTEVIGYRVEKVLEALKTKGPVIYTIWANASTALPYEVTMEIKDFRGENEDYILLLRDFDFDAEIDESLFGLGPAPEPDDTDEDQFIIQPGVGIGELHFGDSNDKVIKVLGKPDFMMGDWLYQYTGLAVVTREGKVYSFQGGDAKGPGTRHVQQCRLRTAEGIGMDSSEQEIVEVYGEPTRRTTRKGDISIVYRNKGMGFTLRDDKVYLMSFSLPKEQK